MVQRVAPEAKPEKCDQTAGLRQQLDIDSFDFLRLLIAISDEFRIDIPESHYAQVSSLNDLVDYIHSRLAAQHP